MENITIEKMEIKRFNALLMRTIVGMLFMGVLMWETFCLDTGRKGFLGETWYIFRLFQAFFQFYHDRV